MKEHAILKSTRINLKRKYKTKIMQLEELKKRELGIRAARIKKLKQERSKMQKIDFKVSEAKFSIGGQIITTWVTFFIVASITAFLICFIAFGDTRVSVCDSQISSTITNFCIGWQSLFMLTFSIIILPITFLIGTVEFFQSIKQGTTLKELSEQLQFQKDLNTVSKVLVYSLFILSIQILIYFVYLTLFNSL